MMQGRIQSIAFGRQPGLPRLLHETAELRAGHGIVGDHQAGRSVNRALNLIDQHQLESLQELGYDVQPGVLGENLVLSGLPLDELPAGTRLQLGDTAVARVVKPRTPCSNLTYIHPDFPAVAEGRVGQMCAVERGGVVSVGDEVVVLAATLTTAPPSA